VATQTTSDYFHGALEERKRRLTAAMSSGHADAGLNSLLAEVDAALDRLHDGTFGNCEGCNGTIEGDRLLADPLIRFCLDHLTEAQRRELERDLEGAAAMQRALLPAAQVRRNGWHICSHYKPAGPVSGDYCDVIVRDGDGGRGDELYFIVGDVSGKGVSASLFMSQLHAMFRSLASVKMELDEMLASANRLLCESSVAGRYATLICARVNGSGEVEIVNAGHPAVWLVGANGVEEIAATGLPLGLFRNSTYTTARVRVNPRETLFLYTDGLSEAQNAEGVEYSHGRLGEFIQRGHGLSPEKLMEAWVGDLQAFSEGGKAADDLTLMLARRES
jgi:sigma-B regulation protein RsbU (phosphoserine phosphatase)